MSSTPSPSRFAVILAFGLVYLFWGSTYLAIDIAVQTIPPALMCGVRFSIAGVVMLVACAAMGKRIWYSTRQIALAAVVGVLLLMGGNLTLSWAELSVPSGLAALIIAITPLWFLVLDSMLLGHHGISGRGKAGLGLGIRPRHWDGANCSPRSACWADRSPGHWDRCYRSVGNRAWTCSARSPGKSPPRAQQISYLPWRPEISRGSHGPREE
jgi:hypothetical protein